MYLGGLTISSISYHYHQHFTSLSSSSPSSSSSSSSWLNVNCTPCLSGWPHHCHQYHFIIISICLSLLLWKSSLYGNFGAHHDVVIVPVRIILHISQTKSRQSYVVLMNVHRLWFYTDDDEKRVVSCRGQYNCWQIRILGMSYLELRPCPPTYIKQVKEMMMIFYFDKKGDHK